MQYIILIGDESLTIESVKGIEHYGSTSSHDASSARARYCVVYDEDRIFYAYDDDASEYNDEELLRIPFENPRFITMVYRSAERMKQVLKQDNFLKGIYVDDDAGSILPIEDFIKLLDQMGSSHHLMGGTWKEPKKTTRK